MKVITSLNELSQSTRRANSLVEAESIIKTINESIAQDEASLQLVFTADDFNLSSLSWSTVRKVQELLADDYSDSKERFKLQTVGQKQSSYTKRVCEAIVYNNLKAIARAKKTV
jgi:hypothetical protein